ncbi:hypothetical protein JCM10213_009140 [Rhodosporidiobolus nylandii]
MAALSKLLLVSAPLLAALYALLAPRIDVAGLRRLPHSATNIGDCTPLDGLEACEDAWVHHESGLAYLACSSLPSRSVWQPAGALLDGPEQLAATASRPDALRLFDFSTRTHSEVRLEGLPKDDSSRGRVYLHGLDVLSSPTDPDELYLFLISHRPRLPAEASAQQGADSVVEVFRTRVGSSTAQYVRTLRHEALLKTPNNLVADAAALKEGKAAFWASNDHARRLGWERNVEMVWHKPSEIVYCEASLEGEDEPECKVAAEGIQYPNGMVKGPNDLLYSASTFTGEVSVWEIQQVDKTLLPVDTVPLHRPIDNLQVSPTTGAIFAATFPKLLAFGDAAPSPGKPDTPKHVKSPVEIWRVANETGEAQFYGQKYATSIALADPDSKVVSAITSAAPYKDQLLLTGFFSPDAALCKMPEVL